MKNPGIHIRLMMAAFLLICATTFTLHGAGMHIIRNFIHTRFQDRISFLARYLAMNSEVGILIGDRTGLDSLARNLLQEEDVARVMILGTDDDILVDVNRPTPGPVSLIETPVVFLANDENILFSDRMGPAAGADANNREHIGKVRIFFSTHGIDQLIAEITRQFFYIALGLTLIGVVVYYFLSRSIVQDVTQLATTARHVGRGDLELRAPEGKLPETRDLAMAFNTMLDSLEKSRSDLDRVNREMIRHKALAERGKFSLMVAHEFKNPLGIIKSALDILKKELGIAPGNTMVEYIEDEIKRLNRMIEDFLLFAKPVKPFFRPADLNLIVREIAARFDVQHTFEGVEIVLDAPAEPFVSDADADLLTRALSNIIKNACEANGNKGRVSIRARHAENDRWIVEIGDQGDGISEEHARRLFEPFYTTRSKGTGLGLAFTLQVVEAHDGIVSAENQSGGGALFRVVIPRKNRESESS
jgi:signal transduction histidine kinase